MAGKQKGVSYSNPGFVNTDYVRKTSDGVTEKPCKNGSTHVSAYNRKGHRISWDKTAEGKIENVHSTDANNNHINYKGGH